MHVWRGRRVLVTGHTGFKGSWLVFLLRRLGAEVHGYALNPATVPNLFSIAHVPSLLSSDTRADIRDRRRLLELIERAAPEVVFHLAAQPLVRDSFKSPLETFDVNAMGTANLLDVVSKSASVKVVLIVTTDKCYKNLEHGNPFREEDPLGGNDPYSASKACAEIVANSYRESSAGLAGENRGVRIASARAGNVIGGGDWSNDRLIPDCVRAFCSGAPVELRYPNAVRPWLHVLEPLTGYINLAERLLQNGAEGFAAAFNFGPRTENECTVLQMAKMLAELWGEGAKVRIGPDPMLSEAVTLRLDSSKAMRLLGWSSRWSLNETLGKTVEWYKAWISGQSMAALMARQIEEFERKAQ